MTSISDAANGLASFAEFLADLHVPMTRETLRAILDRHGEYSASIPDSYKYPGRIWARHDGIHDPRCAPKNRRWMLGRYDLDPAKPGYMWINMLPIRFVESGGFTYEELSAGYEMPR